MEPLPLHDAVEVLKRDPSRPVMAQIDDLTVELRAVSKRPTSSASPTSARNKRPRALHAGETSAADVVREIGAWEGEPLQELLETLSQARLMAQAPAPA